MRASAVSFLFIRRMNEGIVTQVETGKTLGKYYRRLLKVPCGFLYYRAASTREGK